jgi:hypothetical protein
MGTDESHSDRRVHMTQKGATAPKSAEKPAPGVWVPRDFVENRMAKLKSRDVKVYLCLCEAIPAPDPRPTERAKAQLDIAEIARATGFSREWANKSISVLVSTKLIVSGGRNGPAPAWYWLTTKRLAGSEPIGFIPVSQIGTAKQSLSTLTPKPVSQVQGEQDQERSVPEQPTTPEAPERNIVLSQPQPQGLIAQAERDVRASVLTESPADKQNERPGQTDGEDEAPAALFTGSGSWSSPQGFRPVTGALLHAIARPVQVPAADQPTERRPDVFVNKVWPTFDIVIWPTSILGFGPPLIA